MMMNVMMEIVKNKMIILHYQTLEGLASHQEIPNSEGEAAL